MTKTILVIEADDQGQFFLSLGAGSLALGDDPGRVGWAGKVMEAVRHKGFDLDDKGKIIEVAKA